MEARDRDRVVAKADAAVLAVGVLRQSTAEQAHGPPPSSTAARRRRVFSAFSSSTPPA